MEALRDKAMRATGAFLTRRGFEILEKNWTYGDESVDFVARNDDNLVFVTCLARMNDGEGFPDEAVDRKANERLAIAYLTDHPESGECTIRFDVVSLIVTGETRASLPHHRNALCAVE